MRLRPKEPAVVRQPFDVDTVTSADGTTIGFRRYGTTGPGLVLLHGGMNAAQDLADLASLLADAFTVYVPDRRGRGMSGPFGPGHTIAKQVDDVRAVLERTGAGFVFGLSAGAVISLEAAAELPQIVRLAVYEPPLTSSAEDTSWDWLARFDREITAGRLGAALVTAAAGTGDTSMLTRLPRFLTEPFLNFVITAQAKQSRPDEVPLKDLVHSMHDDAAMVRAMAGRQRTFSRIGATVLLMSGTKSPCELRDPVGALTGVIAASTVVELAGADHLAATNGERPRAVARELRSFFGQPA
ncbi:MAG: alpha/beta hydrolase [Umezawaea sp.]